MERKLVMIEWLDAYGCSSEWQEIPVLTTEQKPMVCTSVGWILFENDERVVLVPHLTGIGNDRAHEQGCGDMTIPRVSIVKITPLVPEEK